MATLLAKARHERSTLGFVRQSTRFSLLNLGLTNAQIESYLTTTGV